uniref:Cellular communication network factor 1 n=1 Tax=Macrostomum lignano TaxID=282301 RepID=A0A1I8H4Q5_9PLAT
RSFSIVATGQTPFDCPRPCRCFNQPPQCHAGVTAVRDGCGCCEVCARQLGEDCDERYPCDPAGDLVCARDPSTHVAFCRKRSGGLSCHVNGRVYRDGEAFNSTCRYRCLCQDGRVACSDVCWHQSRQPPSSVCRHSSLVPIPGRCCKEWICDNTPAAVAATAAPASSKAGEGEDNDDGVVTKWSACSTTCGVGQSSRLTNDNVECKTIRETRLCMMAECVADPAVEEQRCRSTIRAERPMSLTYTEDQVSQTLGEGPATPVQCRSVRLWKPKFCSGCQRKRCCRPLKVKTKMVEFQCDDGIGRVRQWAWIKRCICTNRGCDV